MTRLVSSPMASGVPVFARRGLRACARVIGTTSGAALVPWRCLTRPFSLTQTSSSTFLLRARPSMASMPGIAHGVFHNITVTVHDVRLLSRSARVLTVRHASLSPGGMRSSEPRAAEAIASGALHEDENNSNPSSQSSTHPWYERSFWTSQVTGIAVKQSARLMANRLDFEDPLGIDLTLRGASSSGNTNSTKKKSTRKTLYDYALDVKRSHPKKIALIRVGEFYEALGFDAVLLVMHAGLNPMGTTGVPKAGCPLIKVQETLDRLTQKGYNVVVCEEVPSMNPYGQRAPPKERYVAAIVTPSSPQYVVGAAAAGDDVAFDGDAPPPVVAVAATSVGYTLVSVEPDLRRATVLEGLTSESAAARLASVGHSPPLYRHKSLDGGFGARGAASAGVSGPTRRLRMEIGNILSAARDASGRCDESPSSSVYQRYESKDPVAGILDIVKLEYNLPPDTNFEIVKVDSGPGASNKQTNRPYPLSLATAQQLGVLPTRSVPPILSYVLPASVGAPAACRAYIQELLLHPPPLDTAHAISSACVLLTSLTPRDGGVPRLEVTPPGKIAKLLRTREGSHVFFAELSAMARSVRQTLSHDSEKVRVAGDNLLNPTALKVGRPVEREKLIEACLSTEKIVASVIAEEVLEVDGFGRVDRIGTSEVEAVNESLEDDDGNYSDDENSDDETVYSTIDQPPRVSHVPSRFLRLNEPWRGRVRREVVDTHVTAVEQAALEVSTAIEQDLMPLLRDDEGVINSKTKNRKTILEHDQRNNVLWVRGVSALKAKKAIESGINLIHPVDRWGKEVPDRWSTQRVEQAVNTYRVECSRCGAAVADSLKTLADSLSGNVSDLVAAATFSAIATAVSLHAKECLKKEWHPATLLNADDVTTPWISNGLTPFWMPRDGSAVPNDVTVDGLTILTGPNMAGKSTVLRATASIALLASCGLFVPVSNAVVPHFDSLIARMSSTDSPAEGLSSYAVEMAEVSTMLEIATAKSLVFIDELGRGTEAAHGTAMGGAVVEALDSKGTRGIFATHLHGLLDLNLQVSPYVTRRRMETVVDPNNGNRLTPTWRVVDGECRESLALQTAVDMGVDVNVVQRGKALLNEVLANAERGDECGTHSHETKEFTSNAVSSNQPSTSPPLSQLGSFLQDEFNACVSESNEICFRTSDVGFIKFNETPSAASGQWTCVYVLRRADGWAYCGETDDLATRIETHRQTARREAKRNNSNNSAAQIECVFVTVPKGEGGKSTARLLESRMIRKLKAENVPLLSGSDGRNTSFGSAGS